jgi:hypothetical protein
VNGAQVDQWAPDVWGPTGGSPAQRTYQRLALASVVAAADPGTRLAAAATDGGAGTGLTFSLTGGWTSTDWCGAWPYWIWKVNGADNQQISGEDQYSLDYLVRVRTGPGDSSDTAFRVGLINETDATSGTVDSFGAGINFGTALRTVHVCTTANGTAGSVISGTGSASIVAVQGATARIGKGSTANLATKPGGLDNTDAYVASSTPAAGILASFGNSPLYFILAIGRTAATAGTVPMALDVYINRPPRLTLPT